MAVTDPPLVSVVTPCHNAEAFIGETIESVLAQTHHPVEHLIVDDGSSDGSWAVIERLAGLHPERLRAERMPVARGASHARNRGASHARNRGATLTRGRFLMFLDADDLLAPDALGALVAALRERPDAIAHAPWHRLIRDRHGAWAQRPADARRPSPNPDTALREWLEGRAWVPPCAVLWPRPVFEGSGGWNERFTVDDDGELMRRVLARGVPLIRAGGGGALYRAHGPERVPLSQSAMSDEQLRKAKAVIDELAAELEHQGRLAAFAPAVGTAYRRVALAALQGGHSELAAEYQELAVRLGGRRDVSRTAPGRVLARIVGIERKERLARWLGQRGIASASRLTIMRRRELQGRQSEERTR